MERCVVVRKKRERKRASASASTRLPSLPNDVLFSHILAKLSVKSLSQFRSVSKLWNSTFSDDPSFVRSHFSHSLTRPNGLTLLLNVFCPVFDEKHQIFSVTIPTTKTTSATATLLFTDEAPSLPTMISESLQGLICIAYSVDHVCVCNPSTHEMFFLPSPPKDPSSKFYFYSLGFDPIRNEHKVLSTIIITNNEKEEMIMDHKVFNVTSRSRQWRRIANGAHSYHKVFNVTSRSRQWRRIANGAHSYFPWTRGLCFNGVIYRMGYTNWLQEADFLIAFNVGTEEFYFLGLPDDFIGRSHKDDMLLAFYSSFAVCDGKLTLFDFHGLTIDGYLKYWVLKDDGGQQVWLKNIIAFPKHENTIGKDPPCYYSLYTPISIYTGEIVFKPRYNRKPFYLVFYDLKTKTTRKVRIRGLPNFSGKVKFSDHVESIVSLGA